MFIEQTDGMDLAGRAAIVAAIDEYNDARTGRPEPARQIAVLVRDAAGATLGGAWCVSYYDWLHVDLVHLPEELRGQGLGTRVMRAIERTAARLGCIGVWLDTATFQAPGFYRKLGYTVIGGIAEYGPGSDRLWLTRPAPQDGPDDPGLEVAMAPLEADRQQILADLLAYNDSQAGADAVGRLGLLVREHPGGPVIGGLWGRLARGWLFVELLALPERARGQGLGTELMDSAEAGVRTAGGRGVWLDTFSFQARPFYEKRGYRAFAEIPDYPAPHRRFLLAKRLDGAALNFVPPGAQVETRRP